MFTGDFVSLANEYAETRNIIPDTRMHRTELMLLAFSVRPNGKPLPLAQYSYTINNNNKYLA